MKVLGIGGVFFKTKNMKKMIEWYDRILDVNLEAWNGTAFIPTENNMTIFSLFEEKTDYFPRGQKFMLNFQISSMKEFLEIVRNERVKILRELDENEYGRFIWVEDPDGNWVEIWERQ
ncbi:MAG: VOC family protein [Bacilli bacterium]|nr:VOC family protein [Bacilli bacterium]